jgi:hypothetical protein
MTTRIDLCQSSIEELERLYRDAPCGSAPRGRFRGEALARVDTRFARSAPITAMLVPWERVPFGIDFSTRTWFFVDRRVRVGRFRLEQSRSRWRDAETFRMLYDVSRLPLRGLLYDEVKPLDDGLCLGLGGINFERGRGDLFFFALFALPTADRS